jgi:hypothetical protein
MLLQDQKSLLGCNSPTGHAIGKQQKFDQQTDTSANTQISKARSTVRQQNRSIRRTANSSKTRKISKQQQIFSDKVTAWAVFRPEALGPGIFTA